MRKQRVDAFGGLLGLNRVDAIFGFVALFADGENTKRSDGFKRVAGFRMQHAHANGDEVASVNEHNGQRDCD